MALLAAQQVTITGTAITYAPAAAGGDTFAPSSTAVLRVKNGDASPKTVTLVVPGNTAYGQAQPDVPIVVAAGAEAAIGPFAPGLADLTTGLVNVTYSAVTSVTVALTRL